MAISYKNPLALKQEVEYLKGYVPEVFGVELSQEQFVQQIQAIIDQKVNDYIFQRYRDWTGPELLNLLNHWAVEAPLPEAGHKPASGQRDSSAGILEPLIEKPKRGRPKIKVD